MKNNTYVLFMERPSKRGGHSAAVGGSAAQKIKRRDTMKNTGELNKIEQLEADIQNYKEAIDNAYGAMEEAERELIEELERRASPDNDYPD